MGTIFEKIVAREIPADIIYEDAKHLAFLDIAPLEKGHTLIIPKKAYLTVMEMPETDFCELMVVVHKLAKHFEKTLHCGINILNNSGEIAGQEVPHVHIHLVPRREEKSIYNKKAHVNYLPNEMEIYKNKLKL
ncbi:HIT domain-containing protein [Candidatus Woesearchaeota archaeon]|nr:HIT domain-containing protein [Nanoarchaeota archaeon]MCB9370840.1 HIT domain-containing protein [Candidatus Woesearchaeota archaeon]USN43940.1 MAG: HIT domain-containing protein [Candidatus Woesearchaeota archaeon]